MTKNPSEKAEFPVSENFTDNDIQTKSCLIKLSNEQGMRVVLTNYGARIVSLIVPDEKGNLADVVLGYNSISGYLKSDEPYFGATIGPYANRIAKGSFELNGRAIKLDQNEGDNHLHGGKNGLHDVIWEVLAEDKQRVKFEYTLKESVSGYPGNLTLTTEFILNNRGELKIHYQATSDKVTVINLTNHAYFNLSGAGSGSIGNHHLYLNADAFTPVDPEMIPTGEIQEVDQSPFDFRVEKPIGKDWNAEDEQLAIADGFDHNFILNKSSKDSLELSARVTDPESGRVLEVETTAPGIHFYTANALSGKDIGREGVPYLPRTAFCLETQHFPDSPNKPLFPSVLLEPGQTYKTTTVFRFSW